MKKRGAMALSGRFMCVIVLMAFVVLYYLNVFSWNRSTKLDFRYSKTGSSYTGSNVPYVSKETHLPDKEYKTDTDDFWSVYDEPAKPRPGSGNTKEEVKSAAKPEATETDLHSGNAIKRQQQLWDVTGLNPIAKTEVDSEKKLDAGKPEAAKSDGATIAKPESSGEKLDVGQKTNKNTKPEVNLEMGPPKNPEIKPEVDKKTETPKAGEFWKIPGKEPKDYQEMELARNAEVNQEGKFPNKSDVNQEMRIPVKLLPVQMRSDSFKMSALLGTPSTKNGNGKKEVNYRTFMQAKRKYQSRVKKILTSFNNKKLNPSVTFLPLDVDFSRSDLASRLKGDLRGNGNSFSRLGTSSTQVPPRTGKKLNLKAVLKQLRSDKDLFYDNPVQLAKLEKVQNHLRQKENMPKNMVKTDVKNSNPEKQLHVSGELQDNDVVDFDGGELSKTTGEPLNYEAEKIELGKARGRTANNEQTQFKWKKDEIGEDVLVKNSPTKQNIDKHFDFVHAIGNKGQNFVQRPSAFINGPNEVVEETRKDDNVESERNRTNSENDRQQIGKHSYGLGYVRNNLQGQSEVVRNIGNDLHREKMIEDGLYGETDVGNDLHEQKIEENGLHWQRKYGNDLYGQSENGNDLNRQWNIGNDLHGQENIGSDLYGHKNLGNDLHGQENIGSDLHGQWNIGNDLHGQENIGSDSHGQRNIGKNFHGQENLGNDLHKQEDIGNDVHGQENIGNDVHGQENIGNDVHGQENIGNDLHGEEDIGNDLYEQKVKANRLHMHRNVRNDIHGEGNIENDLDGQGDIGIDLHGHRNIGNDLNDERKIENYFYRHRKMGNVFPKSAEIGMAQNEAIAGHFPRHRSTRNVLSQHNKIGNNLVPFFRRTSDLEETPLRNPSSDLQVKFREMVGNRDTVNEDLFVGRTEVPSVTLSHVYPRPDLFGGNKDQEQTDNTIRLNSVDFSEHPAREKKRRDPVLNLSF